MTPKPIIVLVSGAFHLGSSMKLLSAELERMGWESRTMGLVTVNRADLTVKDDIATLNNEVLDPLIVKEGRDIILCLHSYAGFVASAAIAGMSKSERSATGRQGGIVGLIYMCAFCPTEGDTILGMVGGNPPPWMEVDHDAGFLKALDPKQTFYNDVPEPLATEATKQVYPQSESMHHAPSGPVFYGTDDYKNRRVYIHTTKDQALPPFAQDMFVKNSGVEWDVRRIETGHSPFLSEPKQLASMLVDIAKGFLSTF